MSEDMFVTVKLRLKDRHSSELNRQASLVNLVWNYCNETSKKAWDRDRRRLSAYDLMKLTSGSAPILGLNSASIERVCAQFATARKARGRASIRWRSRKSLGWVPFKTGYAKICQQGLIFRSAVYEPMHRHPLVKEGARVYSGSFNRDGRGRWFVNITLKVECSPVRNSKPVGIDLGLKSVATLSDGQRIVSPTFYRRSERFLAVAQRAGKTRRVQSINEKIANRRRDFLHKLSASVAKEYGVIAIGDVSPSQLARTKMAKSVLDAGWSDLKRMISYKALMHGGRMIEVDERMTTQTCSECGAIPPSRPRGIAGLGIREWTCDGCGAVHDRDVNAAKNILRLGLETLAEGAAGNERSSQHRIKGA